MQCPSCRHENPADALFCEECGAKMERGCASCGAENSPGAKFCRKCGASLGAPPAITRAPRDYTPNHLAERILRSRSALEGERKQVTVLFADVKGSMELAEQLGPEDWHGILDRFFQILSDGVHRFEGTVNQYTGDGIMALFGAPIAHEDHAQRACYAALHIRDALKAHADALRVQKGLNFSVRIGINSGEVVVGAIGDDLRMDYTAQGHTVGLAQRMEALAEAGKALLASETIALVDGYFALRDLGHTKVRGVEEPVHVAELEGVGRLRTRLDRSRARGLSKFVGRGEEMDRLETALKRALAGDGQVVGVMAEAGSGKSRLCYEFLESCRARGITVRTGTCVSHGRAVPLQPILDFYREIFGITPEDGDAQARQKIAGMIAQMAPEELGCLPLLFDFMRVPDPANPPPVLAPDQRQRELRDLLRRLTAARSRQEPAVLVFEDLHWVDPESEAIVEGIVEAAVGTRTLLLANFRPEYRPSWGGRTHYQQIALRPLDAAAADELLADWLGPDPSLEGLAGLVGERTGGNPFFIEELVQAQIEAGALVGTRGRFRLVQPIERLEIPPSVQSLLAARIDRLDEGAKHLLQAASVIGDELEERLLERVAGGDVETLRNRLRGLVQSEFLYESSLYPEHEYAFKHPLTRGVAYASLLGERRRELHASVALAVEALAGDAADARAALLAHHWEEAGRRLEAAGWQARAAEGLGANAGEAVYHLRKVTELLAEERGSPEASALLGQARARLVYAASRSAASEEEVARLFSAARRELGGADSNELAYTIGSYAVVRGGAGETEEAKRLGTEALEMARRLDDPELIAAILAICCVVWSGAEFPEEHGRYVDEIERLCATDPSRGEATGSRALVMARGTSFMRFVRLGRGGEVDRLLAGLRDLVGDSQSALEQTILHMVSGIARSMRGDVSGSLEHGRRGLEWGMRSQNEAVRVLGHIARGRGLLVAERWDEARDHLEQAYDLGIERRFQRPVAGLFAVGDLSRVHVERGDLDAARRVAERGIAVAREMGYPHNEALAQLALATARIPAGDAEGARADLGRAAKLTAETGARNVPPLIMEARAELARLAGDTAGQASALREAARFHRENGEVWLAEQAEARLPV